MSFQHCLNKLARKGASTPLLRLVATFLSNRTMSVRVSDTWSVPKRVDGGCPQGSILGVFLFNSTIDNLENGCTDLEQTAHPGARDLMDGGADAEEEDTEESGFTMEESAEEEPEEDYLFTTPIPGRKSWTASPGASPVLIHGRVKKWRVFLRKSRRPVRLNFSSEAAFPIPPEPNHRTEAKWAHKLVKLLRFVDDGFSLSRVNFENSFGFTVNGIKNRSKHAIQSQKVFKHLVRMAEEIGMWANTGKTSMRCISDAQQYEAESFIRDADDNGIGCQQSLKALGMVFGRRPNFDLQVEKIRKDVRRRY